MQTDITDLVVLLWAERLASSHGVDTLLRASWGSARISRVLN